MQRAFAHLWGRDGLYNGVEQVGDVVGWRFPIWTHPLLLTRSVNGGKIELLFCSVEVEEEFKDLVMDQIRRTVRLIYFIDDHHWYFAQSQSFLQYETRLRHRAFEGVYQQDYPVGHVQYTFYLAPKVAVPWGVDDVDLGIFPLNADILGKDGDPALTLEVVVVQQEVVHLLIITEKLRSVKHVVYQGGFTVVNVGDDGDVAQIHVLKKFAAKVGSFIAIG